MTGKKGKLTTHIVRGEIFLNKIPTILYTS